VTKRATDTPLTRVTATYMSDAQFGVHLDMGRRFGEENQWGVRVNTVTRGGEGNIEGGEQNLNLGSLALDYHSRRLRWSLDAWAAQGETKEMRPQTRFTGTSVPAPPDGSLNFKPGTAIDDNTRSVLSRLEYDITDNTTVYGGMGYMHNYYQQDLPTGTGADASGNFNVGNAWWDEDIKTKSADIGVRTRFKTGGVGHTLALGANFLDQERGYFYTSSATTNPSNLYDPAPLPEITVARLDPEKYQANEQSSVAVADTLSFADEKVLLTLGLRRQNIQQDAYNPATGAHTSHYDASATTPLAGLVVKPLKNVSLYGNYTAGLTRGGQAGASTANAGETFAPQRSKQYEAGVKVDWGKLTTQVALYQIERPNSITDPVTNVYSFGGEQRNRGLELTAYGELQRGLRLLTSMAFIDAELTRTQGGVDQGNTATGVPDFNYNLGLDWDMPWVRGLSLNGRVVGTSEVYMNTANTMTMDGWTRGDVGARYVTEVLGTPMVLRGSVENVTNEKYWLTGLNGYSTLGAPRTYMVSATFDF
jgi:iron complex outermembrane receptor protein